MTNTRIGTALTALTALATLGMLTACGTKGDAGEPQASPVASPTGTPAASVSNSPQASPAATNKPGGAVDLTKLAVGAAPKIAWLEPGTLHTPDGGTLKTTGELTAVARLGSRWLTVTSLGEQSQITLADRTLKPIKTWRTLDTIVLSDTGTAAGWFSPKGAPMVLSAGKTAPITFGTPVKGSAQPVALTGDGCADDMSAEEGGCTLYYNLTDAKGHSTFKLFNSHGLTDVVATKVLHGSDVHEEGDSVRFSAMTKVMDEGSCWAVMEGGMEAMKLWNTCNYSLDAFSTDGKYVLAGPAYRDGMGDGTVAILNSNTGAKVAQPKVADGAAIVGTRWEDTTHVLAAVLQGTTWGIVRIGVDGSVELAGPTAQGDESAFRHLGLN